MVEAFFLAHDIIRKQVAWQEEIARELQVQKAVIQSASFDWHYWTDKVNQYFTHHMFDYSDNPVS